MSQTADRRLGKIHGRRLLAKLGKFHLALIDERDRIDSLYNQQSERLNEHGMPPDDYVEIVFPLHIGGDPKFYSEYYPKLISELNAYLGTSYPGIIDPINFETLTTPAISLQYKPIIDELGLYLQKVAQYINGHENDEHNATVSSPKRAIHFTSTKWSNVTIETIDSETIKISHPDHGAKSYSFNDLKFADGRRSNRPTRLWKYFIELIDLHDGVKRLNFELKSKEEKKVSRLRSKLKEQFGIQEDPIPWNSADKQYQVAFRIKFPYNSDISTYYSK